MYITGDQFFDYIHRNKRAWCVLVTDAPYSMFRFKKNLGFIAESKGSWQIDIECSSVEYKDIFQMAVRSKSVIMKVEPIETPLSNDLIEKTP